MSGRLPADLIVAAMRRRVEGAGGMATILARGDAQAGGILVVAVDRGGPPRIWERGVGPDGRTMLIESTPKDEPEEYCRRRRARDPDLWVVELDVAAAERFAAETMLDD
ncbi:hypothetical protein SAMN05192583_3037 [Sphingomonas gellani]|uniref:DUF1491 domain-containing protein n=1 Tax=Sphingomonas gellani TaxID=1166340 RepID=A0A1H8HGC5_9SPHN|nr:DUF1491 family protein [Sphingomonas gellani]SEN55034.1 hypothetical protein SAMN05192583_3037 [Sphingomonas gellani]